MNFLSADFWTTQHAFAFLLASFWTPEHCWEAFGLFGQLLFTGRFIVQWLASEKKKESVIPLAFWYFSISGSVVLLIYSLYRQDPVYILGQSLGFVIYFRNLHLIFKKHKSTSVKVEG